MSPVAAIDIGTHSTRLLIVEGETVLVRESVVTHLGEGVDATGRLDAAAQERSLAALREFAAAIAEAGSTHAAAVMTSAVRDAANSAEFAAQVRAALGVAPRTLSGDDEARLTYAGATAGRDGEYLVVDIGGGSTEIVVGTTFHVSTQIGVVRQTERHLHSDPPTSNELENLTSDVSKTLMAHVPVRLRSNHLPAIAVAGTPTQCAAMDLGLERYDSEAIEGHILTVPRLRALLGEVAALPLARRRSVKGLDPARAPVIVAGIAILLEVVNCFDLTQVEASERDILWGLARSTCRQT